MKSFKYFSSPTLLLLLCLSSCWEKGPVEPSSGGERSDMFENVPTRVPIAPQQIDEASGIVDSQNLDGYLWAHEDAGDATKLFLVSKDGKQIRGYVPPGITNRDWEDIAIGSGPVEGVSYLYLGDIGNNDANPAITSNFIYRIPELKNVEDSFAATAISKITFRYPDGPRDAETLLFDPVTKDLFVVSKELTKTNLYRIAYPQAVDGILTAELLGTIPSLLIATGGDIAADGREIVIKTYAAVYYWKRKEGETVGQTLLQPSLKTLPYELEPQGEAICFDKEMKGYYTLSERRTASQVTLNYYKRK